jgi:RNA polymerase sigma-70 factor (ECF subfamily)
MNDCICYTAIVRRQSQFSFEVHTNNKGTPEELSDELLITRVTQGDIAAFETLYNRYAAAILGIAMRIIGDRAAAEEVLKETFWQVWQTTGDYQLKHEFFRGWLFKLARDRAVDAYRRRGTRSPEVAETADTNPIPDQILDSGIDIPEPAKSNLYAQQVRNALMSLPREERQVIEMAYFYKMTRQEIAKATGEPLDKIHTRARLGLKKLHEELEKGKGFDGWKWKEK